MNTAERAEIMEAVRALGYSLVYMTTEKIAPDRYLVRLSGQEIGIYDTNRHTFVD